MVNLKVNAYLLKQKESGVDIEIVRVRNRETDERWAVRDGQFCLNKQGKFEYEPLPSNRDDAFFERCRWDSPHEAYTAYAASLLNAVIEKSEVIEDE